MWPCAPKSWKDPDTGFLGTPPKEDSSINSDALPVEDSSKRPDTPDKDGSSSSPDEANLNFGDPVAKAAKCHKLQTSAAGGKPSGEYLCWKDKMRGEEKKKGGGLS